MRSSVRKIGNSAGVILSKPVLAVLGAEIGDQVEVTTTDDGKVVITSVRHPREGWEEDAKRIAAAGVSEEEREWLEAPLSDDDDIVW